jgi:hypothetical protein
LKSARPNLEFSAFGKTTAAPPRIVVATTASGLGLKGESWLL